MAVTNYYSYNGVVIGESTGGVRTAYGPDALGSTVATYEGGAPLNSYLYAPYGTQVQKTGTAPDPKFGWNGASGYRNNARNYSGFYVRARDYDYLSAQWLRVDPLWPQLWAYVYAGARPSSLSDPSGAAPPTHSLVPCAPASWYTTGCITITVPIPVEFWGINEIDISVQTCVQRYNSSRCPLGRTYATQCTEYSGSVSLSLKLKAPSLSDAQKIERLGQEIANVFLGNGIDSLPIAAQFPGCICPGVSGYVNVGFSACLVLGSINGGGQINVYPSFSAQWWFNISLGSCGWPGLSLTASGTYSTCQ